MYLVDTDWIADLLAGRSRAYSLLAPLVPDGLSISIITYAEIYQGIFFGQDPRRSERAFKTLLQDVRILPLSRPIARRYARIRGTLRVSGTLLPPQDILIAATAIHHDLTLVTRNLKHFQRIPNLNILEEPPTAT